MLVVGRGGERNGRLDEGSKTDQERVFRGTMFWSFAGPMPSAHAEQGVGEAGAPPCRLPHRQRVRVAGAQSFQPLLHILLVSRAHVQGELSHA